MDRRRARWLVPTSITKRSRRPYRSYRDRQIQKPEDATFQPNRLLLVNVACAPVATVAYSTTPFSCTPNIVIYEFILQATNLIQRWFISTSSFARGNQNGNESEYEKVNFIRAAYLIAMRHRFECVGTSNLSQRWI